MYLYTIIHEILSTFQVLLRYFLQQNNSTADTNKDISKLFEAIDTKRAFLTFLHASKN